MQNSKINSKATKLKSIYLQDNSWTDVEAYLKDNETIIIPVGATEQHGPAAALGLDTYNAIFLAEDVAKSENILMTPPLWFGDSSHHGAFPGTITLRSETMIAVVKDMLRSLLRHGFKKIIIINGHKMSNLPALTIAAKDIHEYEYPKSVIAIADPWKIARGIASKLKGAEVEHHAGALEVAQLMHKRPDLVDLKKLNATKVSYSDIFSPWGLFDLFGKPTSENGEGIDIVWSSREQRTFTPTGQFSPNAGATNEMGKEYHDYMVVVLQKFVKWLKSYDGPIGSLS